MANGPQSGVARNWGHEGEEGHPSPHLTPISILLVTLTHPRPQSPHLQNNGVDPRAKGDNGGVSASPQFT